MLRVLTSTSWQCAAQFSKLGGEIQIQLALAQSANGKDDECIETFKWIEQHHPLRKVKQQAHDLRYIMEAPKLPINDDERIMMPSMSNMSPNRCAFAPLLSAQHHAGHQLLGTRVCTAIDDAHAVRQECCCLMTYICV